MQEAVRAVAEIIEVADLGITGQTLIAGEDIRTPTSSTVPIIIIRNTGGFPDQNTHDDVDETGQPAGNGIQYPSFQISIRHAKYLSALAHLTLVRKVLNKANHQVDDVFFLWLRPVSPPFGLPATDGNANVAFNVRAALRDAL
jgi:hypothetical protein